MEIARRTLAPTSGTPRTHIAILCVVRLRLKRPTPLCPKLLPMNRPSPNFIPEEISQHNLKESSARIPKMKCPTLCPTPSCIPHSNARPPNPTVCLVPSRAPSPFARPPRSVPPPLPCAHLALSPTPACNPRPCAVPLRPHAPQRPPHPRLFHPTPRPQSDSTSYIASFSPRAFSYPHQQTRKRSVAHVMCRTPQLSTVSHLHGRIVHARPF